MEYDVEVQEESGAWSYVNHFNKLSEAARYAAKYQEKAGMLTRIWARGMRVGVIRKTDSVFVGSMYMQVGMVLTNGRTVTKVNEYSYLPGLAPGWPAEREHANVYLDEARRFGFKKPPSV